MHFWKSSVFFLGLTFASLGSLITHIEPAKASAPLSQTFLVSAPTSSVGTIQQVRIDPADDKVYVLGSSTAGFGVLSADGSSFSVINYSSAIPAHTGSDLAISQGKAFIVRNAGINNGVHRFDIDGSVATLVASSTIVAGTSAMTFGENGKIYVSKGLNLLTYDSVLTKIAPTSTLSLSATRLTYGGDKLFYLSSTGRFMSTILDGSDTTISSSGPTSANAKGLNASADGSALYYASSNSIGKISVSSGLTLWTKSLTSVAGMDVNTSTGRITVINTSGIVTTYLPINPVISASASASGTSAILSWDADVSDDDFGGITIRRSRTSYPTSVTDGEPVTSTSFGTSFIDTDLSEGEYYYSFFNQTLDGYYSEAVTSTVTINLPPEAPVLTAETSGNSVSLSWSIPADTAQFILRRSTDDYPLTPFSGIGVTTTESSVTSLIQTDLPDGVHYYSLFASDAEGNVSFAGTASVTIDTVSPYAPILSAVASSSRVLLSWDVPPTTASFLLRRSNISFPANIFEGTAVTSTILTEFIDAGRPDGTYYYSIFASDSYGNYSSAGTASTTIDTTAPSTPSSFAAVVSGSNIHLTWSNPIDSDFASTTIRRSASSFPTSTTDGSLVIQTPLTEYVDTYLADGTYYYSIFAEDLHGLFSIEATSSATVNTYVPPTTPSVSGGGGGGFFLLPSTFNTTPFIFLDTPQPKGNTPATNTSFPSLPLNQPLTPSIGALSPSRKTPSIFTRILRQGDRGNDVKALQVFLNTHGAPVAKSGQGSVGNESTYFGPATTKAVTRFQELYKNDILKPYGLEKGTGIFGNKMKELIDSMK